MRGGGSEQQVALLLRHLDRQAFEPHLYLLQREGDLLADLPNDVVIHSFDENHSATRSRLPGGIYRAQVRHLEQVIEKNSIDVVYDRTFQMTMIAGGARCASVPRVSTIVSPPELAFPLVEKKYLWLKRRKLAKAYRQSGAVVAVSRLASDSAQRFYGMSPRQIQVIHNPVDAKRVRENAKRESPPSRDERLTLVAVGRMTQEKGHRDLIEAFAQLETRDTVPPLQLWLIGDGPLRSELQSLALQCLQRHRATFLGTCRNPAPAISAADVLVLPSHFEGMPNVVLEAFALSTPVIATRAGGTVELERESPTILWAQPNDPRSLADAIAEFASDRRGAETRVQAAGSLVHDYHDAEKTVRRIEDLLR